MAEVELQQQQQHSLQSPRALAAPVLNIGDDRRTARVQSNINALAKIGLCVQRLRRLQTLAVSPAPLLT